VIHRTHVSRKFSVFVLSVTSIHWPVELPLSGVVALRRFDVSGLVTLSQGYNP
jgi:hypothetical protein